MRPRALRPIVVVPIAIGGPILAVVSVFAFISVVEFFERPRRLMQARAAPAEAVAELAKANAESERAGSEIKRADDARPPHARSCRNRPRGARRFYCRRTRPRRQRGDGRAAAVSVRVWLVRSAAAGDDYAADLLDRELPDAAFPDFS